MLRAYLGVFVLLCASTSWAVGVGDVMPTVTVDSASRSTRTLPDHHAHIIVIEDSESRKHRQPAHAIVGRWTDTSVNRSWLELVAVADVAKWSWWPARDYVLRETAKSSAKESTPIWLDWNGALKRAFDLRAKETTFIVVGDDDRVRFFAQGTLTEDQQRALDRAIASLKTP